MGLMLEIFLPEDFGSALNMLRRNPPRMGNVTAKGSGGNRFGSGHFPVGGQKRKPGQPGPKVQDDPEKLGEFGEAYGSSGGLYIMMKMKGGFATWFVDDKNDKFQAIGNPIEIKTRADALNVMRIHHDEKMAGL